MTRTDDSPIPDYLGLLRLDGRRFVVLGAGQGIGRQATHALAAAGARCFCVDLNPDLAANVALSFADGLVGHVLVGHYGADEALGAVDDFLDRWFGDALTPQSRPGGGVATTQRSATGSSR